jgi:hypothetical protein
LNYPNHLSESILGTVVDIYGNIVDLNRNIVTSGSSISFTTNEENQSTTFIKLRELARKGLAYHWELNARKDLNNQLPDVNNFTDYARDRSRLFVDVDKEGQFKINVPCSSERGNIGLLARYENYSAVLGAKDGKDPRLFVKNVNKQDVLLDAFGKGVVSLNTASDEIPKPIDRKTNSVIKLGTAFHNVEQDSLVLHKRKNPISGFPGSYLNKITPVTEVVDGYVTSFGANANAGGRSGTISLDGSLNVSVGANTSDRQSLWLDMAGGMVVNIGRDKRNVSSAITMDGDCLVQIGGPTITDDTRFNKQVNSNRDGVLDIRVVQNAQMHVIRIDSQRIRIHTSGALDIVAEQSINFRSVRGEINFDAENIYFYPQTSPRLVNRASGSNRTI